MAGTWAPYTGIDALTLAVLLLVTAGVFAFLGVRLRRPVAAARPGRAVTVFILLIWVVSLLAFVIDSASYGLALKQAGLASVYQSYTAPNPISPLTEGSAAVTFVIIAVLTRSHGLKVSLLSAFVGAAAAPMIFELPFDLIVLNRIYPPIPPSPTVFRLLFFLPLFLVEFSTMSFLTFSPVTRLSRYTLFSMTGFFLVFAAWAAIGFSYPADPLDTAFNDLSKVLCFVAAITLFVEKSGPVTSATEDRPGRLMKTGPPEGLAPAHEAGPGPNLPTDPAATSPGGCEGVDSLP